MEDSYILQVEKAITKHLQDNVAGGFDVSQSVFRGRDRISKGEPVPMISILQASDIDDTSNSVGDGDVIRSDSKMYLIQGFCAKGDIANPTDLIHGLLAECKKVLNSINDMDSPFYLLKSYNSVNIGKGLVGGIEISSGLVRPPDQEISSTNAFFWLPVRLQLLEDLSNPYAAAH